MENGNRKQIAHYNSYTGSGVIDGTDNHHLDPLPVNHAEKPAHEFERHLLATKSTIDGIRHSLNALSIQDGDSAEQLSVTQAKLLLNSVKLKKALQTASELMFRAEDMWEKAKSAGEGAAAMGATTPGERFDSRDSQRGVALNGEAEDSSGLTDAGAAAARASAIENPTRISRPRPSARSGQHTSMASSANIPGWSKSLVNGPPAAKRRKMTHTDPIGHDNGQQDAVVSATTIEATARPKIARPSSEPVRKPPKKRKAKDSSPEDPSPKGIDDLLGLLQVDRSGKLVQANTLPDVVQDMLKSLLDVYMSERFPGWYVSLRAGVRKPKCAHAKLSHEKAECSCAENSRLHIQLDGDSKTIVPNGDEAARWDEKRFWIAQRNTAASSPSS